MFHSQLLRAGLFLLIATPLCAQIIVVPPGAPLPNFQPGASYQFPAGYPTPPGGWQAPYNVGITVGGAAMSATAINQSIYGAAQDAARAAAASGGAAPNFQFLTPLDGLNVNVLDGGVTLPADVGTPTLIQSGSSLMIGSTPPVVGGGGSAKPASAADRDKPSESKSGDKDKNENEKGRSVDTASPGKPAAGEPSASVAPVRPVGGGATTDSKPDSKSSTPPASWGGPTKGAAGDPETKPDIASVAPPLRSGAPGGGNAVPPEKKSPNDPTPAPNDGKPGDPRAPELPKPPGDPRIVIPDGGPKPPIPPRLADPNPPGRPRTVVATPREIHSRDPVAERIDQGMERDIGVTPPIMHRINDVGVSVPTCMGASREGLACD